MRQTMRPATISRDQDRSVEIAERENSQKNAVIREICMSSVGDTGLETTAKSAGKIAGASDSLADSYADSGVSCPLDPDLATVVDAWPTLSEPIKAAILAIATGAGQGTSDHDAPDMDAKNLGGAGR